MATFTPLVFPAELLAKWTMRHGATTSVAAASAFALGQHYRNEYILRVLTASPEIRSQVRAAAIANVVEDDSLEGQKQMVCILTAFELLDDARKRAFINAYAVCSTLTQQGVRDVTLQNTWQPGHVPPRYEP